MAIFPELIRRRPNCFFFLALAVILLDQAVKICVKLTLGAEFHLGGCEDAQDIRIAGNTFKITFAENPGAAFSMTFSDLIPGLTPFGAKIILSLFSFVAVFVIVYFLIRVRNFRTGLPWLIAMILGGALGNMVDRVFYGIAFQNINCLYQEYDPATGELVNFYQNTLLHGRVVDMFYFDIYHGVLPNWIPFWGGSWVSLWPVFNIADSAIFTGIVTILVFQRRLFGIKRKKPVEPAGPDLDIK